MDKKREKKYTYRDLLFGVTLEAMIFRGLILFLIVLIAVFYYYFFA